MSVPLDLSLISQLLNEQRTTGDLNALTKPGFFYVTDPTNKPNDTPGWCHVINVVDYAYEHTEENMRIFQMCTYDVNYDNTIWYRKYVGEWTGWERFVTATDLQNSTTKIDDQTTLSKWHGMFSYQDGVHYNSYSVIPSAIIAQQTPTSDLTFYFKFVLPAKPEYITDDRPSPLGIATTYPSNLHEAVNTLSAKVILSRDSNTVIDPQLTIYNPNGGDFIYSTRSSADGLFSDKDTSMFIATNTDQDSPASEVEWGQTVIMAIRCHEVKNNPFQGE